MLVASVVVEKCLYSFDKMYDYSVPEHLKDACKPGCRVTVPFGNANSLRQAIVFSVSQSDVSGLKCVFSVEDAEPVLSEEMLKLCLYMREHTFCTYFDAVSAALPVGMGLKMLVKYFAAEDVSASVIEALPADQKTIYDYLITKKQGIDQKKVLSTFKISADSDILEKMLKSGILTKSKSAVRHTGDATQKMARLLDFENVKLTPKQSTVVELLKDIGVAGVKEILYFTGVSSAIISTLAKNGVIELFDEQVFRSPCERKDTCEVTPINLSASQQKVYDGLLNDYNSNDPKVALLYGITGSGKTQVYLKLVDKAIEQNKSVIVMVPEIALTPQTFEIFNSRYGDKIALFHSAMSIGQRMDEWKRAKNKSAKIAVGTRSAIFAPFDDVGLIIMDEEQERSYKSEMSPRFHARDIAKFRAAHNNALLVLASATPSIESYTAAKEHKYSLYTLTERYGKATLPNVVTVDMRKELINNSKSAFSSTLLENLRATLDESNQAILLLNRRGHNTFISCPTCGNAVTCPNCSISMTYHSANKRLMCHYCGYSTTSFSKCNVCGGEHMRFMGIGTQSVEQELLSIFPDKKILRMDADSTSTRRSYSEKLSAFANGEYDVMIGTQMVAKGLNFPKVTLVGVIGADSAMYSDDYRSYERSFSLLTQVVGRSGRGDFAGNAIIQTVNPDSNLINVAAKQDYDSFYNEEILTRKLMVYPPYCDIVLVACASPSRSISESVIKSLFGTIKNLVDTEYKDVKITILSPTPATVVKVSNKYRYRMIIKCKNNKRFRELLRKATQKIDSEYKREVYSLIVDINPESVL